ncbi:probable hydroxamate-type ferrisiderophore receptor (plasmid) [Sinorhizobium fredii NGR234]|uniref:Probable hydroxamate-type ferrisiderophore receptor n=1 Tax=Sinorhizobium fredii (strain NBRC 101917 / NGR234) TaxID=394 RepID=C3KKN0_SINFN|nr:probable hydroxamate-type ferrisiderophore receptor [Sinorhizobium fredii NGR234]
MSESSDASVIGNRPQAVPRYYGSLWAAYTLDSGTLEGLTIGGGARIVGSSYADDANTIKADGYTLLDAALKYDFGARKKELEGLALSSIRTGTDPSAKKKSSPVEQRPQ